MLKVRLHYLLGRSLGSMLNDMAADTLLEEVYVTVAEALKGGWNCFYTMVSDGDRSPVIVSEKQTDVDVLNSADDLVVRTNPQALFSDALVADLDFGIEGVFRQQIDEMLRCSLTQANSDQTVLIMSKFTWRITSLVEEPLKLVERVGSNFLQVASL